MSAEFEATKRGFIRMRDGYGGRPGSGVPITCNDITKQCITGNIERMRYTRPNLVLEGADSVADMLREDFEAFPNFKINNTVVRTNNTNFNVRSVDGDDQDPCVHLVLAIAEG